jgi:competence protein ComEA
LALIGLALTAVGVIWRSSGDTHTVSLDTVPLISDEQPTQLSVQANQRTVIIHVIGQVHRPGIVELDEGARVVDALDASGGITAEADVEALNLARILTDGEQIYVPAVGEDITLRPTSHTGSQTGPISLSRADQATLETLPGVGPALAERIIAFREKHGPFQAVSDLLAVSGIGPAILERLSDLVIP